MRKAGNPDIIKWQKQFSAEELNRFIAGDIIYCAKRDQILYIKSFTWWPGCKEYTINFQYGRKFNWLKLKYEYLDDTYWYKDFLDTAIVLDRKE